MTKRNQTTYALLGLMTAGYRTGYEMKQMIDQSLHHFWKISYGQIYPALNQLTEAGLVTAAPAAQERKPDRKEYQITAEGKKALQSWLEEPIKEIATEKNEFLLKLFFCKQQKRSVTAVKSRNISTSCRNGMRRIKQSNSRSCRAAIIQQMLSTGCLHWILESAAHWPESNGVKRQSDG